jgi:hypothetical protein
VNEMHHLPFEAARPVAVVPPKRVQGVKWGGKEAGKTHEEGVKGRCEQAGQEEPDPAEGPVRASSRVSTESDLYRRSAPPLFCS